MLRVRVCATHMGRFLGQKFFKQGPCSEFSLKTWVGFTESGKKLSKTGSFPSEFVIKVGIMAAVSY